jgi:hypothetical protein
MLMQLRYNGPIPEGTTMVAVIEPTTGEFRIAPVANEMFEDAAALGTGVQMLRREIEA